MMMRRYSDEVPQDCQRRSVTRRGNLWPRNPSKTSETVVVSGSEPFGLFQGVQVVQFQIQFQYIDARLAQESKLTAFGVSLHYEPHLSLSHPAFFRDARHLKIRRRRRNMRIEAGSRRRN